LPSLRASPSHPIQLPRCQASPQHFLWRWVMVVSEEQRDFSKNERGRTLGR
jgi:hypothetical protein